MTYVARAFGVPEAANNLSEISTDTIYMSLMSPDSRPFHLWTGGVHKQQLWMSWERSSFV